MLYRRRPSTSICRKTAHEDLSMKSNSTANPLSLTYEFLRLVMLSLLYHFEAKSKASVILKCALLQYLSSPAHSFDCDECCLSHDAVFLSLNFVE
jgi:hypothetical protein